MSGERILVVEDEGIEALDIQQRLIGLGYDVPELALTGEEAVQAARIVKPDLVIMDIMLNGDLDGIAAAQKIRADMDIPVIYLTAYADEDTLQRAKITEPYGYLVKPFKQRELHITIDMALHKHSLEQKLKESERWLFTTLRSIGDAVIATDDKGLITFMNPIAEKLTGWTQEDAFNKRLEEVFRIINKDSREPVMNPVTKVLKNGVIVGLANHTILVAKNGMEIPIDDSAAPIKDDKDNIIGVILVFRDITERERAQAQLRRAYSELEVRIAERTSDLVAINEQLKQEIKQRNLVEEKLNEKNIELAKACLAKDRFLANMSHELRTPLNAIIGFTGTLLMRLPGPLTSTQEQQLNNISVSANHLLSLINDLLDLSKIESGKVELQLQHVSCNSVVQEIVSTLRPMAEGKGLSLSCVVPNQEVALKTDRRLLSQILLNLISNAIKFTDTGEITVDYSIIADSSPKKVRLSVIDTGVGIKPHDQDKLFKAFSQVGNVNSLWHEGTGLGLHLSKKLADLLNGWIDYKSEYGKGSVFTLFLVEQEGSDD